MTDGTGKVYRPWGNYESLDIDSGFQVKRIVVEPNAKLSLQKHQHRAEHWVVVQGIATVHCDGVDKDLSVNEHIYIPLGSVHRISNKTDDPVVIIEIQCGDYLGEDDIIRLEDDYGREGTNHG